MLEDDGHKSRESHVDVDQGTALAHRRRTTHHDPASGSRFLDRGFQSNVTARSVGDVLRSEQVRARPRPGDGGRQRGVRHKRRRRRRRERRPGERPRERLELPQPPEPRPAADFHQQSGRRAEEVEQLQRPSTRSSEGPPYGRVRART